MGPFSAWKQKRSNFSPGREKNDSGGSSEVVTADFSLQKDAHTVPCRTGGRWESRAVPAPSLIAR